MCGNSCFFKISLCLIIIVRVIYLEGQVTEERDIDHLLIHSPNALSSQDWVRMEPGTRNSSSGLPLGCRDPNTWAVICHLIGA